MHRVFSKVFLGILLTTFIQNAGFSIENEFKNSLVKLDIVKVSDSTYSVNLYTQNKYLEPVKIIKKSDLNYYILLPETKNNSPKITPDGTEIRNVTTNLYPYAGQDVNNGYTKININTTKPLNFNINVKSMSNTQTKVANKTQQPTLKPSINTESTKKTAEITTQTQKKNIQKSADVTPKKVVKQTQVKTQEQPKKVAQAPKTTTKKATTSTTQSKPKTIKVSEAVSKELDNDLKEIKETTPVPEDVLVEVDDENQIDAQEDTASVENIGGNDKIIKIQKKYTDFIYIILSKLRSINHNIYLAIFTTLLTFFVMLKLLSAKNTNTRLKSKADLIDKEEIANNEDTQEENQGQYFVFEQNIKQTGFCDPATSAIKRNYELSSYEPELQDRYQRAEVTTYEAVEKNEQPKSEYDIIQKILKEDTFIDIPADNYKEVPNNLIDSPINLDVYDTNDDADEFEEVSQYQAEEKNQEEEIKPAPTKAPEQEKEPSEPEVLSSVEIAPERGFMCVSYDGNINLMGYIFDDVFALHNFKLPKLENYDIKFRLSEKDDNGARFIVKICDTKLLVKVTKTSIKKEVLL